MSQSPSDEQVTSGYKHAWSSIRRIIMEEGASLSGRELNHVYLNVGDGRFADVSGISAADSIDDGRALCVTDWDDDGKVDLVLRNRTGPRIQLFRNQDAGDGRFLALDLQGVTCNRDAIGTLVTVEAGGRTLKKRLYGGDGFLAQSSKRLHFGLGDAESVDRLTLSWPDGTDDTYEDLAVDTRYSVVQGAEAPVVVPARTAEGLAKADTTPLERDERRVARLALMEKIPLAPIRVPAFGSAERTVGDLAGGPVLLNLWSLDCAACGAEFKDFHDRAADLRDAGLSIVTLCTDPEPRFEEARARLARLGLETGAGYADQRFLDVLMALVTHAVGVPDETPLPMSLLLDEAGQLNALYLGRVEVDDLLADVATVKAQDADLADVRLTPGLRLVQRKRPYRLFVEAFQRSGREDLVEYFLQVARSR